MLPEKVKTLLSRPEFNGLPLTVRFVLRLEQHYRHGRRLWLKENIEPDVAYGLIGDRGTGKSVSQAYIALADYMIPGKPCYSNLQISLDIIIDDYLEQLLREYEDFTGIPIERKPVHYQSQDLDMTKLLSPKCDYKDGVIVVDEINIAMADSWRTMTNQSLLASDFMQLLRKLRSAFIFSCISEMFVPNRVRDAVDLYIQTRDMAFVNESKYYGRHQGENCQWRVFPMTGKIAGYNNTYDVLKRPWQEVIVHARKLWGIVDTYERKQRQKSISSLYETDEATALIEREAFVPEVTVSQSDLVKSDLEDWGWLYNHPTIQRMVDTGEEIWVRDLLDELAPDVPIHLGKDEVEQHFYQYLNPYSRYTSGKKLYSFGKFRKLQIQKTKAAVVPYHI